MKITDILQSKPATLSFEVFPPKTDMKYEEVMGAVAKIATLKPDFMSVTYGAMGNGARKYTLAVAKEVMSLGVTPLAHLTCIDSDKEDVETKIEAFREMGIENVLALRGDIPPDHEGFRDYRYASELVEELSRDGHFCVGGACYPEGHPDSPTLFSDIDNLKKKVDAGCSFLTTQMFFDNDIFYSFLSKCRDSHIYVPIIAGIMPVTNGSQVKRSVALSGGILPSKFRRIIDRFGSDPVAMRQAGIAYATDQIIDLYANGIKAVHVYSMNKPDVAEAIRSNLSGII
ncbi:MAG: methylenetetrahydrofolate reductase [Clostridia bacterium]|nr:methylenetetrahydrofolate reductase [Clostridia bacterium]